MRLFSFWCNRFLFNFTLVWLLLTAYQVFRFGTTDADYAMAAIWGAITGMFAASVNTFSAHRIRCKKLYSESDS